MPGGVLSERDQERILELSWALAGARSTEELAAAAIDKMHRLVGADGTTFLQVDMRSARMRGEANPADGFMPPDEIYSLDQFATISNPIFAEIKRGRIAPFKLSSIIPLKEFLRSEFYEMGYKPLGIRYQAILPVQIDREGRTGFGYTFSRRSKDFATGDIHRVYALQSVLAAHHAALRTRRLSERRIDTARIGLKLTQRELEILLLVSSGMTAVAIGHHLRISARTVRKHVENSYSKLGVHDRLQAVSYCRQAGLLP